jgi:hypothetical protein
MSIDTLVKYYVHSYKLCPTYNNGHETQMGIYNSTKTCLSLNAVQNASHAHNAAHQNISLVKCPSILTPSWLAFIGTNRGCLGEYHVRWHARIMPITPK